MSTEPFQWYDLCRVPFTVSEQNVQRLPAAIASIRDGAEHVLRRKIDSGFTLVSPLVLDYARVIQTVEGGTLDHPFLEVQFVAKIQEAA